MTSISACLRALDQQVCSSMISMLLCLSLFIIIAILCSLEKNVVLSLFCFALWLTPITSVLKYAALNEDYESFVLVITIPAGTSLSQPVCAYSVQLGIIDDQIVEDTQSFTLSLVTASPEGTVNSSGVLEINIMDDDCEFTLALAECTYIVCNSFNHPCIFTLQQSLKKPTLFFLLLLCVSQLNSRIEIFPDLFVDLQSSEYLLNEGKNVPVCVLFSSQLQRSVTVSSHYEDLTNLLRGAGRLHIIIL